MIIIQDKIVSDEVVEEQFICDLSKCKGACCVDGDAGAPISKLEKQYINELINLIWPKLSIEAKEKIKAEGKYVYHKSFGWVTPTISDGSCVYGDYDDKGIFKCYFEEVYKEGKSDWKKPISCHLFPIRVKRSRKLQTEMINYEYRESTCSAACTLGKKEKLPVYKFLKEAIERAFGKEFYKELDAAANYIKNSNTQ